MRTAQPPGPQEAARAREATGKRGTTCCTEVRAHMAERCPRRLCPDCWGRALLAQVPVVDSGARPPRAGRDGRTGEQTACASGPLAGASRCGACSVDGCKAVQHPLCFWGSGPLRASSSFPCGPGLSSPARAEGAMCLHRCPLCYRPVTRLGRAACVTQRHFLLSSKGE